jgi:hypothetical protein
MESIRAHTPEPAREHPEKEMPQPSVPPEMEPVIPVNDPVPGRPGDGQPPPVIASWISTAH